MPDCKGKVNNEEIGNFLKSRLIVQEISPGNDKDNITDEHLYGFVVIF